MAVSSFWIKQGHWIKSRMDLTSKGALDMKRAISWILDKLNVPHNDPCGNCSTMDGFPVRYNTSLSQLEYFNGSDWVVVPA